MLAMLIKDILFEDDTGNVIFIPKNTQITIDHYDDSEILGCYEDVYFDLDLTEFIVSN